MRILGLLLIVAGIIYTIGGSLFGSGGSGDEIARTNVFDRTQYNDSSRGWQLGKVLLETGNNPLVIRLDVKGSDGNFQNDGKLKLLVRLAPIAQDGTTQSALVNESVTLDLNSERTITTNTFEIQRTGPFRLGALPVALDNVSSGNPDLDLDRKISAIEAVVVGNFSEGGSSNPLMGIGLVVLGIIIISFLGRRSKPQITEGAEEIIDREQLDEVPEQVEEIRSRNEPDPVPPVEAPPKRETPKRETNVGKSIKWGRDANKD